MSVEEVAPPKRRRIRNIAIAAALLALAATAIWLWRGSGQTTFHLDEVPVPDDMFAPVLYQVCRRSPSGEVRRYPAFKSDKPLYGTFFSTEADRIARSSGYPFAIDESNGTGTGYDTLYLDANRNCDLTDDIPARSHAANTYEVFFDAVTIPGAAENGSDAAVTPRMGTVDRGDRTVCFLPAPARQGRVRINGRSYVLTLLRQEERSVRYDLPSVRRRLERPESAIRIGSTVLWRFGPVEDFGGNMNTVFSVRGKWFTLSAAAAGDSVTVHPDTRDSGLLRVSHGGRTVDCAIFRAILKSRDGSVALPQDPSVQDRSVSAEVRLPVGDYAIEEVRAQVGRFQFLAQRNFTGRRHDDFVDGDYSLHVRKEKPCDLDIPTSAEIAFSSLPEGKVFRPGGRVCAWLLLATPGLMIQDLDVAPASSALPFGVGTSVSPAAAVQDSTGKVLWQGTTNQMFEWTVPADFAPRSGREALKLIVTWDTKDLFGVLKAEREIIIESTAGAAN